MELLGAILMVVLIVFSIVGVHFLFIFGMCSWTEIHDAKEWILKQRGGK